MATEETTNPLLLDMVLYLTKKGLVEGDGVDTFRDFQPHKPDDVVILAEYNGSPVSRDDELVHRSVQIKVRHSSPDEARTRALKIFEAFRKDMDEAHIIRFTDCRWGQVYLRQSPIKIDADEDERITWGFNVGVTTKIY